ncbi:hypothetical protein ES703_26891 [subsurface metagenome]
MDEPPVVLGDIVGGDIAPGLIMLQLHLGDGAGIDLGQGDIEILGVVLPPFLTGPEEAPDSDPHPLVGHGKGAIEGVGGIGVNAGVFRGEGNVNAVLLGSDGDIDTVISEVFDFDLYVYPLARGSFRRGDDTDDIGPGAGGQANPGAESFRPSPWGS